MKTAQTNAKIAVVDVERAIVLMNLGPRSIENR